MTSAQNKVNKIMQCFLKDKQIGSIYKEKKAYASNNSSIALTAVMGEYFHQKLHTTCPNLKMFLELYHTIGNYCPVPAGFNGARSGNIANYDYWDLTLMKIREWFYNRDDKFNDQLLESQLLHDKGNWKNCKSWLNKFEKSREKNGHRARPRPEAPASSAAPEKNAADIFQKEQHPCPPQRSWRWWTRYRCPVSNRSRSSYFFSILVDSTLISLAL